MTRTGKILIACAIAAAATTTFVAIMQTVSAMPAPQLRPIISGSNIVLASNVVRRPVYDRAGQPVNRLPGRSIGLGTPRKMQCLNYNGRNRCRPA